MHCCRLTSRLGRFSGRLTVVVGLLGFLVVNTGLPLVQRVPPQLTKDKSTPFPCQDRPCGCMSAEECFRGCCCFTAKQRLAWAIEHDVAAPPELLAAAEHEHADGDDHDHAESCCTAATTHTTTCSTPAGACASCDESHAAEKQSDARPRWRLVVVIGRMVGHCRGLGPLSVLTFSALPPVAAVNYRFDWRPTGWLAVPLLCASSIALDIPTRPPCA
ncbi:MAG TPA: hypothetical protein VGG64_04125 [Pirellulales bacterium]